MCFNVLLVFTCKCHTPLMITATHSYCIMHQTTTAYKMMANQGCFICYVFIHARLMCDCNKSMSMSIMSRMSSLQWEYLSTKFMTLGQDVITHLFLSRTTESHVYFFTFLLQHWPQLQINNRTECRLKTELFTIFGTMVSLLNPWFACKDNESVTNFVLDYIRLQNVTNSLPCLSSSCCFSMLRIATCIGSSSICCSISSCCAKS